MPETLGVEFLWSQCTMLPRRWPILATLRIQSGEVLNTRKMIKVHNTAEVVTDIGCNYITLGYGKHDVKVNRAISIRYNLFIHCTCNLDTTVSLADDMIEVLVIFHLCLQIQTLYSSIKYLVESNETLLWSAMCHDIWCIREWMLGGCWEGVFGEECALCGERCSSLVTVFTTSILVHYLPLQVCILVSFSSLMSTMLSGCEGLSRRCCESLL